MQQNATLGVYIHVISFILATTRESIMPIYTVGIRCNGNSLYSENVKSHGIASVTEYLYNKIDEVAGEKLDHSKEWQAERNNGGLWIRKYNTRKHGEIRAIIILINTELED